jgi:hypothetical protein
VIIWGSPPLLEGAPEVGMWMRAKAGEHECPRCHGGGCFYCERTGKIRVCPQCYSQDYVTKQDDGSFKCGACDSTFTKAGDLTE